MTQGLPGQNKHSYGSTVNGDFLRFIGRLRGTVLDVGCGTGRWAPELRDAGASRLLGLEPTTFAFEAMSRYDKVLQAAVETAPAEEFADADAVIFADTLEHLVDPWFTLRRVHEAVRPGTDLFISLPNLQNFRVLVPALTSGRFDYIDSGGVMDRGHLRWFTRRTLRQAVGQAGWHVDREGGVPLGRIAVTATRLSRGRAAPLVYYQLYVHAQA